MLKILVLEKEIRLANLIKRNLEKQVYSVDLAFNGCCGRKLALEKDFDLFITDIFLPVLSGAEFCKEVKKIKPYVPILMLIDILKTGNDREGFTSGADDYIVKPFDISELLVRISTLINRFSSVSEYRGHLLKYADLEMNLQTKSVSRNGMNIDLTPKEFNLLEYFIRNKERVISRSEIAEKVWNILFDTGTNFIDVYINYLRKKIDKNFNIKLIRTRSGMGFILKKDI